MKFFQIIIGAVLFAFSLGTFPADAAEAVKIGVINLQKILETSSAGKASQAEINKQGKAMEAQFKSAREDLEELKKRIDREALVMSREAREEKEREFRIKANDLRELEAKFKQEISALNHRLVKQLQDDVVVIVGEVGKKEGYALIVEKNEGGVVFVTAGNDITDKIIQMYNMRFAQQSERQEKSEKK